MATFRGLTQANLRSGLLIDGGLGSDKLTWDNTVGDQVDRYVNWELFELTNSSQLIFENSRTLTLGDAGTGTGTLTIDSTSTVFAGDGTHAVVPFNSGLFATVMNAGTIDLTNGSGRTNDSFRVQGNYIGQGGKLRLDTFLSTDGSPSDKLVIDGGVGTGSTSLLITNAGGPGDVTVANGILVVDAINGGTTAPGAFTLGGPAVAGPYEYLLFRSSVDASNPQAWYLRSTIDRSAPGARATVPPCGGGGGVGGGDNGGAGNGGAANGDGITPGPGPTPPPPLIPNFRQEVSLYAAIPALTLLYGRTLMDTLHERVGEQEHLRGSPGRTVPLAVAYGDGGPPHASSAASAYTDRHSGPYFNEAWGRVIAQHGSRDGDRVGIYGDGPKYDFDVVALQAGLDVYRRQLAGGYRVHAGLYGALGDVRSGVTRFDGRTAGHDNFMAYSVGSYWTLFGSTGWYFDSVMQGT